MTRPCVPRIGNGTLRPDIEPEALFLTVEDVRGTYAIPYIQSARELAVSVGFRDAKCASVRLELSGVAGARTVTREKPEGRFASLSPGEH